jgi:magnesium transporter
MHTNIVYAHTDTDQEEIAQLFSKYSLAVLPIVDNEKRLVGIVTADDIIEVVQEEGTEDLQMVAAIAPIEDKPYLKTSVFSIWLQRIPWLCILMLSATFTGIVINSYESTLSPLLFACVPMLMGTGGNAGSRASVTAIRSIALGEVEFKDGDIVMHMIYGRGVVIEDSGNFISVAFAKNFGIKKLLKNHKSIKKI